jgi:YtcA family
MTSKSSLSFKFGILLGVLVLLNGCDPSINFYGSFFPAWIWCLTLGIAFTILLRFAFAALRLERHLGPLIVVYLCLALLLSCIAWLVLFKN